VSTRRRDDLGLRPLTARSVILSVLLGSHPPVLPVRSIVRTTELFGITEGTTRVALSRLVADEDVLAEDSHYRLSDRLVARQRRLDEGRAPATRPWRGGWEMAVVGPGLHSSGERAAVGAELAGLRLGELRSGVWVRPANLHRTWPSSLRDRVWRFEVRRLGHATDPSAGRPSSGGPAAAAPAGGPSAGASAGGKTSRRSPSERWRPSEDGSLAASLWDLRGWAGRAEALLGAFDADETPAHRFMTAAAIVRHLQTDPLLPPSLLPVTWPGARLRRAYAGYERELGELFRRERRRHG
jgi:phenylacetic acid degradation operon negative regulatory protein